MTDCANTTLGYLQAGWDRFVRFTDEVRANSEDDDTMVSLEQLEKERSYESIEYHKPHTAPYAEYLKRKRVQRMVHMQRDMLVASPPTRIHNLAGADQDQDQRNNTSAFERHGDDDGDSLPQQQGATSSSAVSSPPKQRLNIDVDDVLPAEMTLSERIVTHLGARPQVIKWLMHIVVAMCVGCFVATVSETTHALEEWRLRTLQNLVTGLRKKGDSNFLANFEGLVWWIFSAIVLVATGTGVVVFIEPVAGGSGLPQVMAYLNGVLVRNIFAIKTFCVKTVSVIGAVAGGLPCGAEAPFVHLGAAIGNGVSQGRSRTLGFGGTEHSLANSFRNSKDRRDFTTAGAACGVAAAFGSPIGGMLFVMEEAAVMWDLVTSTQIFLGSMTAFTAMAILDSVLGSGHGYVSRAVSVMFQVKYAGTIPLNITAVLPAMVLGAICGLLTVVFTKMNLHFVKLRAKYIAHSTWRKLAEPVVVVIVFAGLMFALPQLLPCHTVVSHDESASKLNGTQSETAQAWFTENTTVLATYMCHDPEREYSPLATLSTGLGKRAIRRLMSRRTIEEFPFYVLFIFFTLYFTFATYVNGSAIASGLIIPFIVMGSAVGRMFGVSLVSIFATDVVDPVTGVTRAAYFEEDSWMDPGVYALIGAGAFVAGATRMTISIPVIMVELSGELRFLLPIMIAASVARAIADTLCVPLYHQLLHLVCVPYLPHSASGVNLELFTLRDLCGDKKASASSGCAADDDASPTTAAEKAKPICLPHKPTLKQILDLLHSTKHHLFPVIEELRAAAADASGSVPRNRSNSNKTHKLHGTVSREDLQILLALPEFGIGPQALTRYRPNKPYTELRYEEWLKHETSMFFLLSTHQWQAMWRDYVPSLSEEKQSQVIDLRVILNTSPWTVEASSNLQDAFSTFRTMCLRHLLVVENDSVLGIVTRKDLLPYRLRQLQAKLDAKLLAGAGFDTLEMDDVAGGGGDGGGDAGGGAGAPPSTPPRLNVDQPASSPIAPSTPPSSSASAAAAAAAADPAAALTPSPQQSPPPKVSRTPSTVDELFGTA